MQTYLRKSGLVVAEESADEAGLQRALEQLDSRLILTREVDRRHGCFVWNVHVNWATDRPATHVLRYEDERGRPLPLSSGLLERVRERLAADPDSHVEADRRNDKLTDEVARLIEEASSEAARLAARFGHPIHSACFHRGVHLRRGTARGTRRG